MTNFAIENLKALKVHPNVIKDFEKGVINYSHEPLCSLFWITDEMKAVIEKIELDGKNKVYHVIKGRYRFPDGDEIDMISYLYVSTDCDSENYSLDKVGNEFYAYSFVDNTSWGISEFGDILVRPFNGGIKRLS